MKTDAMDNVFHALSSAIRRRMLDIIQRAPGCCVNDVEKCFEISRIAVMKHLRVLETAHLIISQKKGRTRELYFNAAPIQMIYDRWTTEYSRFWATQAMDLKYMAETVAAKKQRKKTKSSKKATKKGRKKHE